MTGKANRQKSRKSFWLRRRNTLVALALIFAVLLAGYFVVRSALSDEEDPGGDMPSGLNLLPGEASYGGSVLLYPQIDRKDLKTVKIHNPANKTRGEVYVDWGIGFAYDAEKKDSYGYLIEYDYASLDETQLTYFAVAVGTPVFSSRLEDHCSDFSPYGLDYASDEEATYILVEKTDGTVHKIYVGNKNPSGTGYYVRVADSVTDSEGNTSVRDAVYLLASATSSYYEETLLSYPPRMLDTLMTYPISSTFSSYALSSSDGRLDVSFLPVSNLTTSSLFGGSSLYRSVSPEGYFSSSRFETSIQRFEYFAGEETMEYATKLVSGTDEDGEEYSFYAFDDEVLAKYGLDPDHVQFFLMYSALYAEAEEHVISEVYFSDLRPDGYYYAYSLSFNTIVRVDPSLVDFLEWDMLDFIDSYILRMSIGYCEELTMSGKIDGVPYRETFRATIGTDNVLKGAFAENLGEEVDLDAYRMLFTELYTTILWGEVPEDLDFEELTDGEPYLEITVSTPRITVYVKDEAGNNTSKVETVLPSVKRILRFYRYSNGRALMTVEMIDEKGESSGESGSFYVLVSRLDKLIRDTKNVCDGVPFSYYDKE